MSITANLGLNFLQKLIFVQIPMTFTKIANFSVASGIFQLKRNLLPLEPAGE